MEERRRHRRYPASEMAYVVGLESPALITDVSQGGIGVRYKGSEELPLEMTVDLLHASKSIVIDRVRCRKARDETRGRVAVFSYIAERQLGLEFISPTPEMLKTLEMFTGKDN
ncbi:MAG: PilZ domain-containing protein [bacterium]|nr:MAG: PilZ domain-containing protein [bacterium]